MQGFDPAKVIGHDEETARLYLEGIGLQMRVTVADGESLGVTADMRDDRLNVHTAGGVVIQIAGIQ